MEAPKSIRISVVYALPKQVFLDDLTLPAGSTLESALNASSLLKKHPELDLASLKVGIFGKLCKRDQILRDQDRVEVYRPLIADPKEVRRQRAAAGKTMKKGAAETAEAA